MEMSEGMVSEGGGAEEGEADCARQKEHAAMKKRRATGRKRANLICGRRNCWILRFQNSAAILRREKFVGWAVSTYRLREQAYFDERSRW
jgi:hypothetical protein